MGGGGVVGGWERICGAFEALRVKVAWWAFKKAKEGKRKTLAWIRKVTGINLDGQVRKREREQRKEASGSWVANKTPAQPWKGPEWAPAPVIGTRTYSYEDWYGNPQGDTGTRAYDGNGNDDSTNGSKSSGGEIDMAEINGVTAYVAALDECAEAPEDMMSQAEARYAAAAAAAESDHDNGAAAELAEAWRTVCDALSSAGESSASAASQAHQEYDSVIEALSGNSAPAAQQYLGDQ